MSRWPCHSATDAGIGSGCKLLAPEHVAVASRQLAGPRPKLRARPGTARSGSPERTGLGPAAAGCRLGGVLCRVAWRTAREGTDVGLGGGIGWLGLGVTCEDAMGLRTILKKVKQREKEMRLLMV